MSSSTFIAPVPFLALSRRTPFSTSPRRPSTFTAAPRMTCAPLHPRPSDDILRRSDADANTDAVAASADTASAAALATPRQLANLELRAGDPVAAALHLHSHLQDSPHDARSWLALAKAVLAARGRPAALTTLRHAVSANPLSAHLWHYFATLTAQQSGARAARRVLHDALARCAGDSHLQVLAAGVEADLGDRAAADALFDAAEKADPSDPGTYLARARLLRKQRRFAEARAVFHRGLNAVPQPRSVRLCTAYAMAEGDERRYDSARLLFSRAAEVNPKDRMVWQPWAVMEERAGNLSRARELFDRAIIADPSFVSSWHAWGMLERRANNLDAARCLFERGSHADAQDGLCWRAWALLEADAGHHVEARRLFTEAAARLPDDDSGGQMYLEWGRAEQAAGEIELSRAAFKTGVARSRRSTDRVKILHVWAGMERREGDLAEARRLYGRALQLNGRDHRTMHAWAKMELDHGDFKAAKQLLTRSVRCAPYDHVAVGDLAKLEFRHFADDGGVERGRELLERSSGESRKRASLIRLWANLEDESGDSELAQRLREQIVR